MNAPALAVTQSPLESAMREVHATLAELLLAADEQYAAVAAHDRARLESVTRQQERLSARLGRAERQRLDLLDGASLTETIASLPATDARRVESLRRAIGAAVEELHLRQARSGRLLERTIELGKQTLDFLQRLGASHAAAYNLRGVAAPRRSVLLDGCA